MLQLQLDSSEQRFSQNYSPVHKQRETRLQCSSFFGSSSCKISLQGQFSPKILTAYNSYTIGIESASFVYTSEIFPTELRAQGVAFSMQGLFLSSILWTSVASPAFANIGYRFYIVFICTSVMMIFIVYFFFPEVCILLRTLAML
jgi:hypothetical protein